MQLLLIHGLGRTPASLALLAKRLREHGYRPHMFGYFAATQDFDSIVERLRSRMHDISVSGPFCVVTHSLGAVLTRAALPTSDAMPQHVVMLAPPNRPPRLAKWAVRQRIFTWVTRDSGEKLADEAFYRDLPVLDTPYTIIAGDRGPEIGPFSGEPNDGVVSVSETRMKDTDEPVIVHGTHTFLMNRRDVADLVISAVGPPLENETEPMGELP